MKNRLAESLLGYRIAQKKQDAIELPELAIQSVNLRTAANQKICTDPQKLDQKI